MSSSTNTDSSSSSGLTSFDYDLLVIGGGSGGIATAKRAAMLYNARVAGKNKTERRKEKRRG